MELLTEPNVRDGGYIWDILEEMMSHFDHIGCRGLSKISHNPPEGYSYLMLFIPTRRNVLNAILGPNPLLQVVIDIDPTDCLEIKGFVWEKEEALLKLIEGDVQMDAWKLLGYGFLLYIFPLTYIHPLQKHRNTLEICLRMIPQIFLILTYY